jgi:hypothetical protein
LFLAPFLEEQQCASVIYTFGGCRVGDVGLAGAGDLKGPVTLRYHGRNDRVCFAPARATAEWGIVVGLGDKEAGGRS